MANHKSSEKRARQDARRNARNTNIMSAVKTFEKKVVKAIENKSAKEAKEALTAFTSKVMSAVSKGVVKKTNASRKVSRLATRVTNLVK